MNQKKKKNADMKYYQRISRVLFNVLIVFCSISILQGFKLETSLGVSALILSSLVWLTAGILIFKVDKEKVSSFGVPFVFFIGLLSYFVMVGGRSFSIICITLSSIMGLLFMIPSTYKVLIIAIDVITVIATVVMPGSLVQISGPTDFIMAFVGMVAVQYIAYRVLINIKGQQEEAAQSEQEALKTLKVVEDAANVLAVSVDNITSSVSEATNGSFKVAEEVEKINIEAVEQVKEFASMEEMCIEIQNQSERSEGLFQNMYVLQKNVQEATEVNQSNINNVSLKIDEIREQIRDTVVDVREFSNSMKEVIHVLGSIHEISNQTNLLALNASIEAARAGEAGKGFAVVADEVRVLSEQTKSTTSQIEQAVQNIQAKIGQVVKTVEKGDLFAEEGQAIIRETSDSFENMKAQYAQIQTAVQEQRDFTNECLNSQQEIGKRINQTSEVSKKFGESAKVVVQLQNLQQEQVSSIQNDIQIIEQQNIELNRILHVEEQVEA